MGIKEFLLRYIPENKFFDICNFIEEVYLMDYDILILMARKFFNLFCVFHEVNCQKYENLKIPYQHERIIITNRALPLLKKDLQDGKFKKIVIADDIVIHGRSIREVYDELISLCPNVEVLLMSYVRNDQDTSFYNDIIEKFRSRYLTEFHDEWRELSDEIVNVFYISGRPYISYLPFFTLDIAGESLKDKLCDRDCLSIRNEDMKRYGVEAYVYTGKEIAIFQQLKYCKIASIRFYEYSTLNCVIAVPYFCMDLIEDASLKIISDFIRNQYLEQEYQELLEKNGGADKMRIMELEYTMSAWMFMHFSDVLEIPVQKWNWEIEHYNFYKRILPDKIFSCQAIIGRLKNLEQVESQINLKEPILNEDISILLKEYEKLKERYKNNFSKWNEMHQWKKGLKDYMQRFVDNYLVINGNIDEKRCEEGNHMKKRLFGIPVCHLIDDLADFQCELYGNERNRNDYVKHAFANILTAVDSGEGTIVTKTVDQENKDLYNEAVIYAGEQNYKFYENTNFPIMYGLYLIEQETKRENAFQLLTSRKETMLENFARYLEQENIFYIKEEMQQISGRNISYDFKNFLLNSFEKYQGNPVLDKAISMALNICGVTKG